MTAVRTFLRPSLHACILLVFFLVPWWLRPNWLPSQPYVAGFLVSVPLMLSIVLWLLMGAEGFFHLLRDSRRLWLLLAILFVAWAAWSPEWALRRNVAQEAASQLGLVLLFALIVNCAGPSPRAIAAVLAAGLLFQGVIVIGQVILQRPVGLSSLGEFLIRPNRRGLSVLFAGGDELMRPYGLTIHPNVIGGYFAVALLAISGWLITARHRRQLIVLYLIYAVGLWALLITFSRSAILAAAVGAVCLVVFWGVKLRIITRPIVGRLVILTVIASIVSGGFVLTYSKFVLARAGVGDEVTELRSISDRRIFTQIGLDVIGEYPVTGVGLANFPYYAARWLFRSPYSELKPDFVHSYPLLVITELGFTGFILWAFLLSIGAWIAWKSARDPFAVGIGAGAVALLTVGLFDHYPWTILHFALLLWACLGVTMQRPRSSASTRHPPTASPL